MSKFNQLFLAENRGSISVEFAIIIPMLIFLFLFVLEMSRIMLIGSSLDLMTTEISRKTAITEDINKNTISYSTVFNDTLTNQLPWWPILTAKDNFVVNVKFCNSIQDVIDNKCNTTLANTHKIILFELDYQYSAMISSLFSELIDASLKKRVVVYREFYS